MPGLNILMGPNGSGKSSLVSAIVLGLGGKPSTIGRSNDINDYIMSGKEKASIELELFNSSGSNYIIKRKFTRDSSSTWYINNQKCSLKNVESVIKKLNIQVDNLCQLLPQDRVQDFAKMTSVQLFENTLKTIGFSNLSEKLTMLKELRANQISFRQTLESKRKLHQEETSKIQRLEKDVQSILERKKVLRSITSCRQKVAWLTHNKQKEELLKVQGYLQDSISSFDKFEKELDPLKNRIRQIEKEISQKQQLAQSKENQLRKVKDSIYRQIQLTEMADSKILDVRRELEEKLEAEKSYKSKVNVVEERIKNLKDQYGQSRETELLKVTRESDSVISSSMASIVKLREKEDQYLAQVTAANNSLRAKEHELNQANSLEKLQFEKLSHNRDVLTAYKWLQANRDEISAPVYGPMFMELNIKDPEGAKYVEAAIPYKDLVAFVAETPEATTELFRKLRDEMSLKINGAYAEPPEASIASLYPPKFDISYLRSLGFRCYLIDLVEGPLPLLSYLCKNFAFHNIPVSFQPVDSDSVPKSIRVFFGGNMMYTVRVSKYSKAVSTVVKKISKEQFFGTTVDKVIINELTKQVNMKQKLLTEYQEALKEIKDEVRGYENTLREERNRKKEASHKLEQMRTISVKLRSLEEEKKSLMSYSVDRSAESAKAEARIKEILEEAEGNLFTMVTMLDEFNTVHVNVGLAEVNVEVARINKEVVANEMEAKSERKTELKARCEELKRAVGELSTEVRELSLQARKLTDNLSFDDPEFKTKFNREFSKLPESIDEIKAKIYSFEARAKCLHNPLEERMLKEYEDSTENSKNLEKELRRIEDHLVSCEADLAKLKEEWLTEVDELIRRINSKFSSFFAAMKCAGEVRVDKGVNEEEIEKYGLEILVKFRDDHGLRVLNGFTQSGGERALTTAVFLLSLQGISIAPFRCIDEINQGMDEFNERRVYNLLFSTVSQDGSQYFLLTPKLLDNIDYPDNCHVHCISNTSAVNMN